MTKIGIIGAGFVGSTYGYSIVTQNLVDELVLIDQNSEVAHANALDIYHGTDFLKAQPKIYVGEYSDLSDCSVICISCGVATTVGQSRLDVAADNRKIIIEVMTKIKDSGFDGIILRFYNI